MPSPADAMYPGGPSEKLGNQDPWKVLSSFKDGNHEAALLSGERRHKEAYVELYGYERALTVINSSLDQNKDLKGKKGQGGEWHKEMEDYRDELLSRQTN
jgi:hypothetical protein